MLNRGTKSTVACVELCSAASRVRAAGVSGRTLQLSSAPGVRRGVGGDAMDTTGARLGASWRGFVPVCAKIFLGNLARAAAVSYANTLNGVEGYWHKTQHSTPRGRNGEALPWIWTGADGSA